jgi:DNA-binding NarL/FixJ family response regulator
MSLRVILKYGLLGGLFIVLFALLKSEWFYTGLYPDIFLTLVALVFAASGMFLRHLSMKEKPGDPSTGRKEELQARLRQLSRREIEVLELLHTRQTNKEIAAKLNIELSTLKTHINSIYKKLGISKRAELRMISGLDIVF